MKAGPRSGCSWASEMDGHVGLGRPDGMTPKREPMVSTGSWRSCTSAVTAKMATMEPGKRRLMLGQMAMMSSDSADNAMVIGSTVGNART